nr:unnamed protein product [Callosobruchus analis]
MFGRSWETFMSSRIIEELTLDAYTDKKPPSSLPLTCYYFLYLARHCASHFILLQYNIGHGIPDNLNCKIA